MNKKGFSLTELLVMLVVLGIIGVIAIPNITGILRENKINAAIEDVNKMYDTVKVLEVTDKTIKPESSNICKIIPLKVLDKNQDFDDAPNGGKYDKEKSFILIKLANTREEDGAKVKEYEYYVRLIEKIDDDQYYGFNFAKIDGISKKDYDEIKNAEEEVESTFINKNLLNDEINDNCTHIAIVSN